MQSLKLDYTIFIQTKLMLAFCINIKQFYSFYLARKIEKNYEIIFYKLWYPFGFCDCHLHASEPKKMRFVRQQNYFPTQKQFSLLIRNLKCFCKGVITWRHESKIIKAQNLYSGNSAPTCKWQPCAYMQVATLEDKATLLIIFA